MNGARAPRARSARAKENDLKRTSNAGGGISQEGAGHPSCTMPTVGMPLRIEVNRRVSIFE